jgi:hypothetical protein
MLAWAPRYEEAARAFGVEVSALPDAPDAPLDLHPHPSAAAYRLDNGLHKGRSLAAVAREDRAYLYQVAADRWAADPLASRAALQALLGVSVTEAPAAWVPRQPASPGPGSAPPLPVPVASTESAPPVDVEPAGGGGVGHPERPRIAVTLAGEKLRIEFDYDAALVKLCRRIPGAEYDGETRVWTLPAEAAVELAGVQRVLEGNEGVLAPLAARFKPVVERQKAMREGLAGQQEATAEEISVARCERYVIRAPGKPGKLYAVFPFNEEIGNMLFQRVGARWNKSLRAHVFDETDLLVVAGPLTKLGFIFEYGLLEGARDAFRAIRDAATQAESFEHPYRKAKDAPLEYESANGMKPFGYQKSDILYTMDCLRERGGAGLWLDMGLGKALPDDAPVLTPKGWVPNGTLRPGDSVIGSSGRETEVLGVYPQGLLPIYRIHFDDGASVECSADHLWAVRAAGESRWRVLTLVDLLAAGLTDAAGRPRFEIPVVAPVEMEARDLDIDPYRVGATYGLAARVDEEGQDPRQTRFRLMEAYLGGSPAERLALLQGLLDHGGTVEWDGAAHFTCTSSGLALDVAGLVESLGGIALLEAATQLGDRCDSLRIVLPPGLAPFRNATLAARYRAGETPRRRIVSISAAGQKRCSCIRVAAADSLYVTKHYVVTHNTFVSTAVYDLSRRQHQGLRTLILCPRSAFSSWKREMSGMLPAQIFYARKKRGPNGRAAMEEAMSIPGRGPVGVVVSGDKKARGEALGMGPDIVIINYDSARSTEDELVAWISSGGPVLIICDESHRIKDPSTKTARLVLGLISLPQTQKGMGGGRIALSGTPMTQGPHEFFTQATFVDGGSATSRFGPSWRAFIDRYFFVDTGKEGKWFRIKDFKDGQKRREFMSMVDLATVRRTKEEELDLPAKGYRAIEAEFEGGVEEALLKFFLEQKEREIDAMSDEELAGMDPAKLFLRMRQLTSHPINLWESLQEAKASEADAEARVEGGEDPDRVRIKNEELLLLPPDLVASLESFVKEGKKPVKLDLLLDLVEDILQDPTEKLIVGCDLSGTERCIVESLKGYNPLWINAGSDDETRERYEHLFRDDPTRRVIVANSRTISTGLTLVAARHMILYDPAASCSTETWLQIQDRVYRPGQKRRVLIDHLLVKNTMDAYMLARVIQNAKDASSLLRDTVSSLPEGIGKLLVSGHALTGRKQMLGLIAALKEG